jgi:phosphoglycolate phosphatase-like HAD superfamily hydrolase
MAVESRPPAAGQPPTDITAVIFDFDGVLVESADIKTNAFIALYAEHGPAVVEAAVAHHQANGGISRRKKIRFVHRRYLNVDLSEPALDALCARFSALVEDAVVAADWVPGALDFLCRHQERMPMFVVSGTPHGELVRIIARRGMGGHFTEAFGSPPEKPPIIRGIIGRHGLQPETVLFVGDAMTDYRAASATGLPFVGRVPSGQPNPFPPATPIVADLTALAV